MRKITGLLILFCATAIFAQEGRQNVAVYMAGKEPVGAKGAHKILGSELAKAITNSDTYSAVDRTDAVLKQIEKEHKYQRSGAVSDEQIKELGRQLGVQYLCIAEISEVKGGTYFLEARLVDVEKATVLKIASVNSSLKDNKEIVSAGQRVARELIFKKNEIVSYIPEEIKADPNKAITDYTEAILAKPNEAEYFNNRGLAYYEKVDCDIAIADFTEAIRLKPNEAKYFGNRGKAYRCKRDYDKAIIDFTEAIRLEPNNAEYRWRRASVYEDKKDYDKAIADYTEAIWLEPKNARFRCFRASVYEDKKDYDKAIVDYNEAIRLDPKDAWFRWMRAMFYEQIKQDYDKAIIDFTEAIRLEPNNAEYHDAMDMVCSSLRNKATMDILENDDYDKANNKANKAIVGLTGAIRLKPTMASHYAERGMTYWIIKRDYNKAIADFTEAIRLEPKNASNYSCRGGVYLDKGDYDRAVADAKSALRIDPDDDVAKSILEELGD